MSLLDDLNEDLIAENRQKAPKPEWRPSVTWSLTGYLARCASITCTSCGKEHIRYDGIFAEEQGSNGTRRLTASPHFPMGNGKRLELAYEEADHCWHCLPDLGFDNLVDAPAIPTNIAGQGLLGVRHGR